MKTLLPKVLKQIEGGCLVENFLLGNIPIDSFPIGDPGPIPPVIDTPIGTVLPAKTVGGRFGGFPTFTI